MSTEALQDKQILRAPWFRIHHFKLLCKSKNFLFKKP